MLTILLIIIILILLSGPIGWLIGAFISIVMYLVVALVGISIFATFMEWITSGADGQLVVFVSLGLAILWLTICYFTPEEESE